MASGGSIKYNIGFNVDKSGLNDLKISFQELKRMTGEEWQLLNLGKDVAELEKIKATVREVETAFHGAFNKDLGTLNVSKFNQSLQNSDLTIKQIYTDFASMGASGQSAFRNLTTQLLTTNVKLKETHSLLDSMATTMVNTVKWSVASSVINMLTGSAQRAYDYVKSLDGSLNDIRIVTGKSAEEMDLFAEKANKAAKALGQTTTDYTDAALIYYQQGLSEEEVAARAEVTLKAANVTGQSGEEVSEQLTAVWNGYKVSAEEAELYIDKLTAVAATTASDLEELSTGMSKVASAANLMGVDVDQLNAQLATIVSVTRQAPESVGTALKTIYARMGDIEAGLDTETTLGDYTEKMASMGVNVLDANGELRNMGEVIEEIGGKWTSMSREQQVYLSQVMAGTRQYNNLLSLFDNWDMYTEALETSSNAAGALQKQQDIYMESTAAHLNQLTASWEDLCDSLLDERTINGVSDALSGIISLLADFVDGIGGGGNVLLYLGSIATTVFSKNIAQGLMTTIKNFQNTKWNAAQLAAQLDLLKNFKGIEIIKDEGTNKIVKMKEQLVALGSVVTAEQKNEAQSMMQTINELYDQSAAWEENKKEAEEYLKFRNILESDQTISEITRKQSKTEADGLYEKIDADLNKEIASAERMIEVSEKQGASLTKTTEALSKYIKASNSSTITTEEATNVNQEYTEAMKGVSETAEQQIKDSEQLKNAVGENSQEYKALANAIKDYNTAVKSGDNDQIIAAAERLNNAYQQAAQSMKKKNEEVKGIIASEANGMSQSWKKAIQEAEASWNRFVNNLKTVQIIQQTVQIVGAIGQVASGLQSLLNIKNILENDDLSAGEKALQIISAAAMAIPMLTTAVMTLGKSVVGLGGALAAGTVGAEVQTAANLTLAQSFKAIWTAMGPIGQAIAVFSAAVAAGAAIWDLFTTSAEEAKEQLEKTSQECEESVNKLNELESSLDGVNSKLEEFYSKDNLTLTDQEDIKNLEYEKLLLEQQLEIQKKINNEKHKEKVKEISTAFKKGSYEGFSPEYSVGGYIDRGEKMEYELSSVEWAPHDSGELELDVSNYEDVSNFISSQLELFKQSADYLQTRDSETGEIRETTAEEKQVLEDEFRTMLDSNIADFKQMTYDSMKDNFETMYDHYQTLTEYEGSEEDIQYAQEWLQNFYAVSGQLPDMVTKAMDNAIGDSDRLQTLQQNLANKGGTETEWTKTNLQQVGFLNDEIERLELTAKASGVSLDAIVDQFIALGDTGLVNSLEYTTDKFKKLFTEQVGEDVDYSQYEEGINNFINDLFTEGYDFATINEALNSVDLSQVDWTAAAAEDVRNYQSIIKAALEEQEILQLKNGKLLAQNATDLQGSIAKEGYESLDEDQLANLEELEKKYSELGDIQNKNSHEYLEKLREITEIEEENAKQGILRERERLEAEAARHNETLENLQRERDYAINVGDEEKLAELNVEIQAEVSAFEETMQDLQDNYAEMQIQIEADFQSDIDSAFGLADEFGKLQEMVADDLTLTFEEAQDLINQGYGAILQNAQETSEQTIQLDKATMNSFIDSRQTELEASRQQKLKDIEMQRAVLVEQKEALEAEIAAYQTAANAKDATSAAAALNEAKRSHATYLGKVQEHNDLLSKVSEGATEEENINEELYGSISEMYATTSENAQEADYQATETQKANIDSQIANVKALYDAYVAVGHQKLLNETNPGQEYGFDIGGTEGGTESKNVNVQEVKGTGDFSYDELEPEDLEQFFDEDGASEEFKNTMDAAIDLAQKELDTVDARIGALDAADAALRSANLSLDKAQKDAKVGGSKSKSSSGKDSSEKEEKKDVMELVEDERDMYHDINYELEQINRKLSQQEKITSKLTGKDKIEALKKESDILDKQIEKEQVKLGLLEQERNTLKEKLTSQGVKFDAEGDISNYNKALDAKLASLNAQIAVYNSLSATEQEARKAEIEAIKEQYEQFKKDMERYEDIVLNEIEDQKDAINEALDAQIEKNIEAFELEIELKIDTKDAQRQLNDFVKKYIKGIEDDNYVGNAQFNLSQIQTYTGANGDLATYESAMKDALEAYENIKKGGADDIYGDDAAKAMEAYEKYRDLVFDTYGEIGDLIEEIHDAQLDAIDDTIDKTQELVDKYDRIGDSLERNLELSKLLDGEENFDAQIKYYDAMKENNARQIEAMKERLSLFEQQIAAEKAKGIDADSELIEKWEKGILDAEEALAEKVSESLELIAESYKIAAQKITKDLENSLTGGLGLDFISEEWEYINENADMYLDTINSAYEISQLESKILDAIDNTDSLYVQERLNKLKDQELNKLRQKEKITQYDVDRANKLLDIELKKIALEEAQSSKTQMRLRRDSQGNYTYQYVADENKISDAQQALAEAENELYNMDKEQYKSVLDDYQSALSDYIDEVAELMDKYGDNTEEFYRHLSKLKDKYAPRLAGVMDIAFIAEGNLDESTATEMMKLYGVDLDSMADEERKVYIQTMIPQMNTELAKSMQILREQGIDAMMDDLEQKMTALFKQKQNGMTDAATIGGVNAEDIANAVTDLNDEYKNLDIEMKNIVDSHIIMHDSLRDSVKEAEQYAENMKEAAIAAAEAASHGNALVYGSTANGAISILDTNSINIAKQSKGAELAKDTTVNSASRALTTNDTKVIGDNLVPVSIFSNYQTRLEKAIKSGQGAEKHIDQLGGVKKQDSQWMNQIAYKDDSLISIKDINPIGDIQGLIDKLDYLIQENLMKIDVENKIMEAKMQQILLRLETAMPQEELQQQVSIQADFPNVNNTAEIEEAFKNLINVASQYAYKTNR